MTLARSYAYKHGIAIPMFSLSDFQALAGRLDNIFTSENVGRQWRTRSNLSVMTENGDVELMWPND